MRRPPYFLPRRFLMRLKKNSRKPTNRSGRKGKKSPTNPPRIATTSSMALKKAVETPADSNSGSGAQMDLEHGDQGGDRPADDEPRHRPAVEERPRLEHRLEQDRAGHRPDHYHRVAEPRVQGPDLVEQDLHDRQRREHPDHGPITWQTQKVRRHDKPQPGEQARTARAARKPSPPRRKRAPRQDRTR